MGAGIPGGTPRSGDPGRADGDPLRVFYQSQRGNQNARKHEDQVDAVDGSDDDGADGTAARVRTRCTHPLRRLALEYASASRSLPRHRIALQLAPARRVTADARFRVAARVLHCGAAARARARCTRPCTALLPIPHLHSARCPAAACNAAHAPARTAAVASRPAPRATHRPSDQKETKETAREEEPSRQRSRRQMAHHREPGARDAIVGPNMVKLKILATHL